MGKPPLSQLSYLSEEPLGDQYIACRRMSAILDLCPAYVETKFDLQRPFLSGLGSIRDFLGFSGGHGVISRLRRENRAQEAV